MTKPTPDGVPCRHCEQPIFWDEICWVHANGFADCGLVIEAGDAIVAMNPKFIETTDPKLKDRRAEPVGEWT
jgi:hypothetical protein